MTYDPVIKDLVEIKSESYFLLQRLKFWKAYAEYLQIDIDPDWYSQDSYKIPMVDLDLHNGKQFTSIYEPSLAATIKRDIKSRFNAAQTKITRYLDGIDKGIQQLNFLKRIQMELHTILEQIKFTDDKYSELIRATFESKSKELLNNSKSRLSNVNLSNSVSVEVENSNFYYKHLEEDEGKKALEDFCIRLKRSGLIENTSVYNLKKIFSDRQISEKVAWKGGKNEFLYFIHELEDRELFNVENLLISALKSFTLFKNDGTEYSNKDIRFAGKLKSLKKRTRIDALIQILDIDK